MFEKERNVNPFKYGCVVDGEFFCPRPKLERQLTPLQVSFLRALAEKDSKSMFSEEFMRRVGTNNTGSIRTVIKRLVAKRLIYQYGGRYRFANPFFKAWLSTR